jgi:hypothetical protein
MHFDTMRTLGKEKEAEGDEDGCNVGVVQSSANTTIEAITNIYSGQVKARGEEGRVGADEERTAENIAG